MIDTTAREPAGGLASVTARPLVSRRSIVGLVAAIAAADWVANSVVPADAQLPVKLAIVAAFVAWARRGVGLSWDELGLDPTRVRSGLRWGALAAAGVAAVIVVAMSLPGAGALLESARVHHDIGSAVFHALVVIPIGTVVFEEVIFRGVLLGVLRRVSSPRGAVITSSALFGLWHLPPALHAATGTGVGALTTVVGTLVVTAVAGVAFAMLRLRSGSLVAPLLAHVGTNSFAYLASAATS